MAPPLLLTPLAPTPDNSARPEPLVTLAAAASPVTCHYARGLTSESSSYDAHSDNDDAYPAPLPNRAGSLAAAVACQWTGAPIRAIVPLPRRKGASALGVTSSSSSSSPIPTPYLTPTPTPSVVLHHRRRRSRPMSDDDDIRAEGSGSDDDDEARQWVHYRSYESITAAQGLTGWSFEELRVECYAQSLVARGTAKPPPVVRPSLAIPPAFVPRIVSRYS